MSADADFCTTLKRAIDAAPDATIKAQLQALYDQACGGVHTEGGPTTPPTPPKPQ